AYVGFLDQPGRPSVTQYVMASQGRMDFARHPGGCVAPGNYPGGSTFPTTVNSEHAVARMRGVITVDQSLQWTFGVHANDSVRVTVGGVRLFELNWLNGDWKRYRYVTFEQPGTYEVVVEWTTNHVCEVDP